MDLFVLFCFLNTGSMLCSPGCPGTQYADQTGIKLKRSTSLCLPSDGIKGMCHHEHNFLKT